jgi:hypothetical protein
MFRSIVPYSDEWLSDVGSERKKDEIESVEECIPIHPGLFDPTLHDLVASLVHNKGRTGQIKPTFLNLAWM